MTKLLISVDLDGVLHSYSSGWKGAHIIPDPPVEGAMQFIWDTTPHFRIAVFSSRSHQSGGKTAMEKWLVKHFTAWHDLHQARAERSAEVVLGEIEYPHFKPTAWMSIDDRGYAFTGPESWPTVEFMKAFVPWNKRTDQPR